MQSIPTSWFQTLEIPVAHRGSGVQLPGETPAIREGDLSQALRCLRSWIREYRSTSSDDPAGEEERSVSQLMHLNSREQRAVLQQHAISWIREHNVSGRVVHSTSFSVGGFTVSPDALVVERQPAEPYAAEQAKAVLSSTLYVIVPAFAPKAHSLDTARMQTIVLRRCGYHVGSVRFLCLDKTYDLGSSTHVNPDGLFSDVRVPKTFERSLSATESFMSRMHTYASSFDTPPKCKRRASCEVCYPEQTEARSEHHIRTLFRGGSVVDELERQGFTDLRQLSDEQLPGRRHRMQLQAIRTGVPHVDRARLKGFLEELAFPRLYLDFETVSRAIPPVSGVKPWEHVPMQFSAHRQDFPGAELRSFSFLADAMTPEQDERCALAEALEPIIDGCGSIIAYAAAFERRTLIRLADWCPDFAPLLAGVVDRIRDLQKPFSEFWYYDPRQHGRTGLKKVLPVMSGSGYEELDVQDGLEASLRWQYEYARALFARDSSFDFSQMVDRPTLGNRLREYCAVDTRGLADIVAAIERIVAE
ncbi:MAG: DUF2779 domain-containing protein [Spirochaetaceae bacterium]